MWTTSADDLRTLLSDGPTDKYSYRKRVFNPVDNTNTIFKTFEWRRVTDFTTSVAPFGVYVDDTFVPTAGDNLAIGEFALAAAPLNGSAVTATYYYQWFLDSEISDFLRSATKWLGYGQFPDNIPDGLQAAALHFAAQEAYQKLCLRWSQRISEVYRLEDAVADDIAKPVQQYMELSKYMHEKAYKLRDDFYEDRQGMALQPLSASLFGKVGAVVPRR